MPYINLTALAADELTHEPAVRAWEESKAGDKIPLLFYYSRCHSRLNNGTTVEHGDGFGISLVDPNELHETDEIAVEKAVLPDGRLVLVRVPRSMLANDVSIGWLNGKFTLEARKSL